MPKRKKSGGTTAAVVKVVLLCLAVIIIIAAAVFGIFMLTNGFCGNYATFSVRINGDYIISNGSIDLPRGSKINITSFSDYTLEVRAAAPEEDFAITVNGEPHNYSEYAGEDMTAGFTFTQSDGTIIVNYGALDEILEATLGGTVFVREEPAGAIFTLIISSGESSVHLNFAFPYASISDPGIILEPDRIIF